MAAAARASLVRLEVFQHLFASVCEEMGAALQRSAFSPNIKERRDFSCALFGPSGELIGQAAHLPVHLGSTPLSVAAVIEDLSLGPGDAALLNDPYRGGTHLPDVTLVAPVFASGTASGPARARGGTGRARKPAFYVANRAHHADVGGAHPGSMAPVADVHGEGLRIPPVRFVRRGEVDPDIARLLFANMRVPREREGDFLAQWSAASIGQRRLQELIAEYGLAELALRGRQLLDWTERLTRAALREVPDGSYAAEDELETAEGTARVAVDVEVRGDRACFDFSRTASGVGGGLDAPRAVTVSAVFYVLRLLLPPGTPTNAGVLRPVEVVTRPGTAAEASYPAPVAAGNVETSQRLVDVLLAALGGALAGRLPAASAGTMSNLTFGGETAAGEAFTYYETLAGGAGGGPAGRGASALQTHMTNTRNTPIEALERALPVRVLRLALRPGSGGDGRHGGGAGLEKQLRFLAPARVSWVAQRQRRGPQGTRGGGQGAAGGAARREAPGRRWRLLGGGAALDVASGQELRLRTPGGGGWGAAKKP